jgi:di/tricarboxylate transporter
MGPGGYRVADFLRAGAAMTVVFLVVLVAAVNVFT